MFPKFIKKLFLFFQYLLHCNFHNNEFISPNFFLGMAYNYRDKYIIPLQIYNNKS